MYIGKIFLLLYSSYLIHTYTHPHTRYLHILYHSHPHISTPSQLQERSSESEEEEVEDDSGEEESDMEVFESLPPNSHFSNLDAGWSTTV